MHVFSPNERALLSALATNMRTTANGIDMIAQTEDSPESRNERIQTIQMLAQTKLIFDKYSADIDYVLNLRMQRGRPSHL